MGEGRAQHQRPDEKPQGIAQTFPIPPGGDLHTHRVDACQEEPGDKSKPQQPCQTVGCQAGEQIGQGTRHRAQQKNPPRRKAIGNGENGEDQRAGDKTQLNRTGYPTGHG